MINSIISNLVILTIVKPPKSDHIGDGIIGLFSKVGPFSEVLM